jgi:hypothetical protein
MASATVSNPLPMALTFVKRRDASFPSRSHQQIENVEAALPVVGLRFLQVAIAVVIWIAQRLTAA